MIFRIVMPVLALVFGAFVNAEAFAQSYAPGDRVQALWAGKWESGTVMPLLHNDLDKTGRVMRIKLDCLQEFLQPDGTEILAKDVRAGAGPAASSVSTAASQSSAHSDHANGSGGAAGQSAFRPGDRVSAMWNGKRMNGVVVPLLANDLDKSGRVLRVRLDDLAAFLQPDGTEILAKDVSSSNAPMPKVTPNNSTNTASQSAAQTPAPARGGPSKENTDSKIPVMNGAVPNLTGTAWKMLYDKAVNVVPLIRFTKKGTYDTVRYSLASGMQGNYRQSGSTVFLNNEAYSMSFNKGTKILLLTGGGTTLKLLYNGVTSD